MVNIRGMVVLEHNIFIAWQHACTYNLKAKQKVMSLSHVAPALPPGTKPLANQVAGHKYGEGKSKLGCLQHIDGTILKPVQYPPKGQREVDFYQTVFNNENTEEILQQLRCHVPQFFGIFESAENPKIKYLKLENLMYKFSQPCVLDIKMGKVTYDPEAPPEKIALELAKFPPAINLGYQFSGMQVFNPEQKKIVKYDKYYCKKLTEDTIIKQGFGKFFMIDSNFKRSLIKVVIRKLKSMKDWFLKQRKYAFYASSILMVYDGDKKQEEDCEMDYKSYDGIQDNVGHIADNERTVNGTANSENERTNVSAKMDEEIIVDENIEVKMIDFTHVFHSSEEDQNYLFGLENLIHHLEILLQDGS
ncbi:hypothetical protein KUTeg_003093 [Tegillarca granosa]|uniref:Kinase n=1 Tax=Tegillarca granosa TaxID=220873 RepID=A0ABQ9FMY6_TEGGR|nr:hypothetical protein KUTeg_003093 [Tegillarca granosa]